MLGNSGGAGGVGHGRKEVEWVAELAVQRLTGAQHRRGAEKPWDMPSRMVLRRMGSWDIYLPSPGRVGYRRHLALWDFQSGCGFRRSPEALKLCDPLAAPGTG